MLVPVHWLLKISRHLPARRVLLRKSTYFHSVFELCNKNISFCWLKLDTHRRPSSGPFIIVMLSFVRLYLISCVFLSLFFYLCTMFSWSAGCFVLASTDKSVTLMVVKACVNKYTCYMCISQIIKLVCLIHVSVLTTHGFIISYVVYSYFQSECM